MSNTDPERVNHPRHYNEHPSGVECIDIVEHMSFNLGNAVKYCWRADHKGAPLEDLRKAIWYIEREIALRARTEVLHDAAQLERLRGLAEVHAREINRRAAVEQLMFDAARGKRAMPTADELRAWALRLGTPDELNAHGMGG